MAEHRHRNDSSQMKDLLQHNDQQMSDNDKPEKEPSNKDNSSQPSCSTSSSGNCSEKDLIDFTSPCSSEPGNTKDAQPSSARSVRPGPVRSRGGSEDLRSPEVADLSVTTQKEEVKLDDLKRLQHCHVNLGDLFFNRTHTVLIDVSLFNSRKRLVPQEGRDLWHSNFVKMPCSQAGPSQASRWKLISKELSALAKKSTVSVNDVATAIIKYNPKYKDRWSFDALQDLVKRVQKTDNYFNSLFPKIAALALKLPEQIKKAIPLLQRGHSAAITLSQVQISCLLANAFFCTFPHRNTSRSDAEYHSYPSINFSSLFGNRSERKTQKLRAIMHYFNVVTDEKTKLKGLVTFKRRCLRDTDIPSWNRSTEKLHKLYISSHGSIDNEGTGLLQVDFASSWIGGGVLSSGLVQEEILFLINPELIVSRLFTERLEDNECLIITGSQQFSDYSGFSDSFEWISPHEENLERDEWARLKRKILAIDALHFKNSTDQYNMTKITRELNKAYCGFKGQRGYEEPDIATGKWGCGAFNGDPQLKAVIQLMAAARTKRGLAFFTFGDKHLEQSLQQTHHLLVTEEVTVGELFNLLENFCADRRKPGGLHVDLFDFIRINIGSIKSQL